MPMERLRHGWGGPVAFLHRVRSAWVDFAVVAGLAGAFFALLSLGREWAAPLQPAVEIDLSPWALPRYTLFSLARGLIAYAFSLLFTLGYGYWAAKDRRAARLLLPLLDVLQSIPVLGFMPGLVLGLVGLFPSRNVGLELASVLMIFTGQVWNMTFSFHHSLLTVPRDQVEASVLFRFTAWQRLRWVELPYATIGLVWNSMMSMAGGWFFLTISEAFVLGDRDFRLPGIGSYMSVAVARGDVPAMVWAVAAMAGMIVALDQVLWRPVVVWSQRFRVEEGGASPAPSSWLLDLLRRSRLVERAGAWLARGATASERGEGSRPAAREPGAGGGAPAKAASRVALALLAGLLGWGGIRLATLLAAVPAAAWADVAGAAGLTLGRVLASTALGTLWALPAGIAIGLSPRLARRAQPIVQFAAAFPAPMLFPAAVALLRAGGVPIGWGSILLMLLGTQCYVLFNVVAGAMAIPGDLREAAAGFRFGAAARFRGVYLPAVFPHLVTGWVTAAGGAWNASIVAECVAFRGETLTAHGLGSAIRRAAELGDLPLLAAGVTTMAVLVVAFNRTVWRRLFRLAETRYSLST